MQEPGDGGEALLGRLPIDAPPTHSEDGADLTLIRPLLSLTPRERLETLRNTIRPVQRLREVQSRL